MATLFEAYVTNAGKYSEGQLVGETLKFPTTAQEVEALLKDMSRDLLRRSHVLVVCGHSMTEAMKNDIAVAQRLGITATTLEGMGAALQ